MTRSRLAAGYPPKAGGCSQRSPRSAIAWEFWRRHRWGFRALGLYIVLLAAIKLVIVVREVPVVFGSEENPVHTATISGGVHATNAMNVQIHFSTINGGIDISGGSGPFGGPFDVTWNTIEDSVINGGYTEAGYDGFWNGFIRNTVHGPVNLFGNVVADLDGNEVVTNTIFGSLNCAGNDPAPQVGDSEGSPNHVTGPETGQCVGL